jgi:glycosyltransferase involved in cell wall biosynthesis
MPTFQGERFVAAALDSVVAQETKDLEVVVVDDGSTDRTLEILDAYSARLPLRIFPRTHGGNWVANTNIGLHRARGEFVSILHQDDCWLPGRTEALGRLAARHCEAVLFIHPARFIDESGSRVGTWTCPLPRSGRVHDPAMILRRLAVQNWIPIPGPMFRRETALREGAMDEDLWFLADWDLWARLACTGPSAYLPVELACFRLHPASQTAVNTHEAGDLRGQYETVTGRVFERLSRFGTVPRSVRTASTMNVELSLMLAALSHGQRPGIARVLRAGLVLGPAGWYRFFRDSRITQRVLSRLRVKRRTGPG